MSLQFAVVAVVRFAIVASAVVAFHLLVLLAWLARVPTVRPGHLEGEQGAVRSIFRSIGVSDCGDSVAVVALALVVTLGVFFTLTVVEVCRGEIEFEKEWRRIDRGVHKQ